MHAIEINNQRILLISDTHGMHRNCVISPDFDIIIHSGDICNDGNETQMKDFFNWFANLPIAKKIFIHGNHDLAFELEPENARLMIPKGIQYYNDTFFEVNEIKCLALSAFPILEDNKKVDIIISHYPPLGILDDGYGSSAIRDIVADLAPKFHSFGHNHKDTGKKIINQTAYINASTYNQLCQKENL